MKDLLNTFSIEQILLFIVMLAIAIKGISSWIDWAKSKAGRLIEKTNEKKEIQKSIESLTQSQQTMREEIEFCQKQTKEAIGKIENSIDLLLASDRDDIKAWITQQHHYFCYQLGYIDDYNLDCIEKRYGHYEDEGGNSFVHDLMEEIRALPKVSSTHLYEKEKINK